MKVIRNGSVPSSVGSAANFTGRVRLDMPFKGEGASTASGAIVTFEPGARTAWHTHPLGQLLFVTAGKGWTQCEGEPVVEIQAGDIIVCPPGHKHWHGATPTTSMTHIAVVETVDGVGVTWLEQVTDADYLAGPSA